MKYSIETIVRFVMALLIALMFVCGTAFDHTFPLWLDLFIRLGGSLMIFVLGNAYGFSKRKDGADNE